MIRSNKPKLCVIVDDNTQLELFKEIEACSITPTTFKTRTFTNSVKEFWYIDKFEAYGSKVSRYGINAGLIRIDPQDHGQELTLLGEKVEVVKKGSESSSIKSSKYTKVEAEKVILHGLEMNILQKAIGNLLGESEGNTVLVDIFARENGAIKFYEDGHPETHTVVLYKNPSINEKHDVLVIDPSNFLFSSHLSNFSNIEHAKLETIGKLNKIITIHKSMQIYKAIDNQVGPDVNQYRDCIDIAVKIAFGLNRLKDTFIDLQKVQELESVVRISNQASIDKAFIGKDTPVRIKQSSDSKEVELFAKIEKALDHTISIFAKLSSNKHLEVREGYSNLLRNSEGLKLHELLAYNKISADKLGELFDHIQHQITEGYNQLAEEYNLMGSVE